MEDKRFLDALERFVEILTEDVTSPRVCGRAVAEVSEILNIGRLSGRFEVGTGQVGQKPVFRDSVLFTSDMGFDGTETFTYTFTTDEPSTGEIIACAFPGRPYDEETKAQLNTILHILVIHIGRYRMIDKVVNSSLTQFLTGLPNSGGYMRKAGEKFAIGTIYGYDAFYFNLKGFGLVNKRFGQKEGNEIILRYVHKLDEFLMEDEVLGHLGGDNFVALVHKGQRSEDFIHLLGGVEVIGVHGGEEIPLTIEAVAGVMHIEMPCSIDNIIGGPAIALSYAKRTKQPVVVLTDQLNDEANRTKSIEQGFEKALANNEFTVFYQPKVNTVTGQIIGAEALTRWFENGRMVPPLPLCRFWNRQVR